MRIGELARRTGVSVRSLRYYEEKGMLHSVRTSGGQREYPESAVDRVRRIQQMFAAGIGSDTIAELLPCLNDADGTANASATSLLVERLARERERIDRSLHDMHRACEVLDDIIDAATRGRDVRPEFTHPADSASSVGLPSSGARITGGEQLEQ